MLRKAATLICAAPETACALTADEMWDDVTSCIFTLRKVDGDWKLTGAGG